MEQGRESPLKNPLLSVIARADRKDVRRIELQLAEQAWLSSRSKNNCSQSARNVLGLCSQLRRRQEFINHLKVYADLMILDGECLSVFSFDIDVLEQLLIQKIVLLREMIAIEIPNSPIELKLLKNDLELSVLMKKINYRSYCQPYSHNLKEIIKAKGRLEDKLFISRLASLEKSLQKKIMTSQQLRKAKTLLGSELSQLRQEKCQLDKSKKQQQQQKHQMSSVISDNQHIIEKPQQECKLDLQELIASLTGLHAIRQEERARLEREYNNLRGRKG